MFHVEHFAKIARESAGRFLRLKCWRFRRKLAGFRWRDRRDVTGFEWRFGRGFRRVGWRFGRSVYLRKRMSRTAKRLRRSGRRAPFTVMKAIFIFEMSFLRERDFVPDEEEGGGGGEGDPVESSEAAKVRPTAARAAVAAAWQGAGRSRGICASAWHFAGMRN